MSAADLLAVLLTATCARLRPPGTRRQRHLIFSKGHASPLLYAAYKAAGAITEQELLTTYRKFGSRLEGHPTPRLPWVDVATGSLGQGLPSASAWRWPPSGWTTCRTAPGCCAGTASWRGLDVGGVRAGRHRRLDNLTAILDINRLGQRGPPARLGPGRVRPPDPRLRVEHRADRRPRHRRGRRGDGLRPYHPRRATAIIARTRKGKGVASVEDREGMHGKPVPDPEQAIRSSAASATCGSRYAARPRPSGPPGR